MKFSKLSQHVGELTLIALCLNMAYFGYLYFYDNKAKRNQINLQQVKKEISAQALSQAFLLSLQNSYQSGHSLIDAKVHVYAFHTLNLPAKLFSKPESAWIRGDKLKGLSRDSLLLTSSLMRVNQVHWVPNYQYLLSAKWYVFPQLIEIKDSQPIRVQMLFIKPDDNLLIYAMVDTDSMLFELMI